MKEIHHLHRLPSYGIKALKCNKQNLHKQCKNLFITMINQYYVNLILKNQCVYSCLNKEKLLDDMIF